MSPFRFHHDEAIPTVFYFPSLTHCVVPENGKPSNLFPLLRAVRHPFGNNQRAYETHFCGGRTKQFGRGPAVWDASGSSNLPQLRELVSSHLLHLKKPPVAVLCSFQSCRQIQQNSYLQCRFLQVIWLQPWFFSITNPHFLHCL